MHVYREFIVTRLLYSVFSQQHRHEMYVSIRGWTELIRAINISAQVCACAKKERKKEWQKEKRTEGMMEERKKKEETHFTASNCHI